METQAGPDCQAFALYPGPRQSHEPLDLSVDMSLAQENAHEGQARLWKLKAENWGGANRKPLWWCRWVGEPELDRARISLVRIHPVEPGSGLTEHLDANQPCAAPLG